MRSLLRHLLCAPPLAQLFDKKNGLPCAGCGSGLLVTTQRSLPSEIDAVAFALSRIVAVVYFFELTTRRSARLHRLCSASQSEQWRARSG